MSVTQIIHCPNCGSFAERYNNLESHIMRTACNSCDYLLVQCSKTCKVIESYAPGINYASGINYSAAQVERPLVAHKQR